MRNNKNIDKLFKDRFENHEVQPPAQVWENIQAAMREEKKDRKVIPLWWKVAGIAALLALIFTIGNSVFNISEKNQLVEDTLENENVDQELSPYINTDKEFNVNNNASEVAEETSTNTVNEIDADSEANIKNSIKNAKVAEANAEKSPNQESAITENNQKSAIQSQSNNNNTIFQNSKVAAIVNGQHISEENNRIINSSKNTESTIAIIKDNTNKTTNEANTKGIAQTDKGEISVENAIDRNKQVETTISKNTEAIVTETELNKNKLDIPESEKQSIFDAIKEQEEVANTEVVAVNDVPTDRWEVAPNFAPVYYNTLSEGSSIDNSFADNSQSGDVNISYGVAVSYAVSDRLCIRSGVNNVNLGYSTGGLELGEGDTSAALRSVEYNRNGQVTIPQDIGTFASQSEGGGFGNITPKSTRGEAFINQNISYYEVPLELKYSLFDTKLGVNVIGGLSTLFLGDNEITVNAGEFRETLGEANNLSDVSFTTNVGLGFDYEFSEKFKFNVEPMFKYQLNPYTDSSVNFQPYYVGVYTGLSYKF